MPLETLSQTPEKRRLQVLITPEAEIRLRMWSVLRKQDKGDMVSAFIESSLPPAPREAYEAEAQSE